MIELVVFLVLMIGLTDQAHRTNKESPQVNIEKAEEMTIKSAHENGADSGDNENDM